MKAKYPIILLLILGIVLSCQEPEIPVEPVIELEKFERFDNFNLQFRGSNINNLRAIDNQLFFAHVTNPGFINEDMEMTFLCCQRNNQMEFRQSLTKDFIAAVNVSLEAYHIFRNLDNSVNPGILDLSVLLKTTSRNVSVSTVGERSNFDINGNLMLAAVNIFGEQPERGLFLFDLVNNTRFANVIRDSTVIQVNYPIVNPFSGVTDIQMVNAFREGWLASTFEKNFFVGREGTITEFTLVDSNGNFTPYMGHEFTSSGVLVMKSLRNVYISETGNLEDLRLQISLGNNFNFALIEDRMVIWQSFFHSIFELENFKTFGADGYFLRELNNQGIEFSAINQLQEFSGMAFIATNHGLFKKSLESFWDSKPETDPSTAAERVFGAIQFH